MSDEKTKSNFSPYYKPLEQVVVRFPLLPVEAYHNLAISYKSNYHELEDRIKYAVMVGSQTLANSLESKHTKEKDIKKGQSKLLRYLIRMSTRCTPYGLFAGVAMANLGDKTELSLSDTTPKTYTRPDMEFLSRFINKLERQEDILRQLHIIANPTVFMRGERVYLQERLSAGKSEVEPRVSIRLTRVVKTVLELARAPIVYNELVKKLLADNLKADKEKIEILLSNLLEQTILITELRPPLTNANPAGHVLAVLSQNPAAAAAAEKLQSFLAIVKKSDSGTFAERLSIFPQLKNFAEEMSEPSSNPVVQVDAGRRLKGTEIANHVAEEVARAAETMLAITSYPKGFDPLRSYRNAFIDKYGQDRAVPILELLDPNFGLGVPTEYTGGVTDGSSRANFNARNQLLLKLAIEAIRDKKAVLEFDENIIKNMKTWSLDEKYAPISLDICVFVVTKSAADIDTGNFQIVIGPNLGATAAGKMLGRFAHLCGETAYETLRTISDIEKHHSPGKLWAELVYLPRKYHAGNVAIRPAIQEYEVLLGVAPGVALDKVIPINELTVGVRDGRFYLRWNKRNEQIHISSGHMLNSYGAPPICRFLSDIGKPPQAGFMNFDWGPAYGFPFLPRVQVGKAVLSPAQWHIDGMTFEKTVTDSLGQFKEAFQKWQAVWNVPRFVYLTNGDNRLLLDTQSSTHIEELRKEFKHLGGLTLQEAYPSLDHAWVPGPDGHYFMEMVVSLIPATPDKNTVANKTEMQPAKSSQRFLQKLFKGAPVEPMRLCPPGSDWLFLKLYCGRELEEDMLMECKTFVERVLAKNYAEDFFFIRYSDPDPHIRIRFHGASKRLTDKLYPLVCAWASGLQAKDLCLKFVLDTYDREMERYGGSEAICLAEKLFAADSQAVLDILAAERACADKRDRIITAVASLNHLLGDMGLDDQARIDWCKKYVNSWNAVSKEYREKQKHLREALDEPSKTIDINIAQFFVIRHERLAAITRKYRALEQNGKLKPEYWNIIRSITHMHCNRLLGTNNDNEHKALGLLFRTLQSLSAIKAVKK